LLPILLSVYRECFYGESFSGGLRGFIIRKFYSWTLNLDKDVRNSGLNKYILNSVFMIQLNIRSFR